MPTDRTASSPNFGYDSLTEVNPKKPKNMFYIYFYSTLAIGVIFLTVFFTWFFYTPTEGFGNDELDHQFPSDSMEYKTVNWNKKPVGCKNLGRQWPDLVKGEFCGPMYNSLPDSYNFVPDEDLIYDPSKLIGFEEIVAPAVDTTPSSPPAPFLPPVDPEASETPDVTIDPSDELPPAVETTPNDMSNEEQFENTAYVTNIKRTNNRRAGPRSYTKKSDLKLRKEKYEQPLNAPVKPYSRVLNTSTYRFDPMEIGLKTELEDELEDTQHSSESFGDVKKRIADRRHFKQEHLNRAREHYNTSKENLDSQVTTPSDANFQLLMGAMKRY